MNFLELCQRAVAESGVGNLQMTAVTNQTGLLAKFVTWVQQGWLDIQGEHLDTWSFLRAEHDFSTQAAKTTYDFITDFSLGASGITTVATVDRVRRLYSDGSKQDLVFVPYDKWLDTFDRYPDTEGAPARWTLDYDGGGIIIDKPAPDAAYTMRMHYRRTAQELTQTTDQPLIAPDYHMVIVWRALAYYERHDELPQGIVAMARREYSKEYRKLMQRYKPAVELKAQPIA